MEGEKIQDNWKAIESNAQVITDFVSKIGFDASTHVFQDLFSLDDWAQDMVKKPCLGLLFIFPINEKQEKARAEENDRIKKEGQKIAEKLFYMKQYAANACGTVGIFHILGNLQGENQKLIKNNSVLQKFFEKVKDQNPHERGLTFKGSSDIFQAHSNTVTEGETQVIFCLNIGSRKSRSPLYCIYSF